MRQPLVKAFRIKPKKQGTPPQKMRQGLLMRPRRNYWLSPTSRHAIPTNTCCLEKPETISSRLGLLPNCGRYLPIPRTKKESSSLRFISKRSTAIKADLIITAPRAAGVEGRKNDSGRGKADQAATLRKAIVSVAAAV